MTEEKSRETRLRHTLARRGYTLSKSRRRDPKALGYGRYTISKDETGAVVGGMLDLNEVEQWTRKDGQP